MSDRILGGYYTPTELAEELGVALSTLAMWRGKKKGPPFIRMGRDVRYSRDSVTKWLERIEIKTQA